MGRVKKGVRCSVVGCENEAVRSVSPEQMAGVGLEVGSVRRVYLCEEHYKFYKKRKRKEKMIEAWRWKT